LKAKDIVYFSDFILSMVNMVAILILALLIYGDFIAPGWTYLSVSGSDFQSSVEIMPILVVGIVFVVTQIYLNIRFMAQAYFKRSSMEENAN